jgi:hypothetical protein
MIQLTAGQVDQVTSAWKRGSPLDRAEAWTRLNSTSGKDERYAILAAASLARREALEAARRVNRTDWAFWAAACDAGAAAAAGARIGRHYETLIAPFAQVVPPCQTPRRTDRGRGSVLDGGQAGSL